MTFATDTLAKIEAAISGRASRTDLEYEIAGRRLKSIPLAELLTVRDKLRREVAAEDAAANIAAGLDARRRVMVRF